ncbi:nuclear transport factor 2 family protein [Altererythrobacter sp. GH1-8]|uniref:nuclear transport factor 2 family protein n=1 Tax=Altererythrobacter sp. GH1-8 TaxID=3349333 RepID=UPI00374D683D
MDEFAAEIESLEHLWARAWMNRDRAVMKGMASRDFVFLLGGKVSAVLDRPSWLDAATSRLACEQYQFHDIYVRQHKRCAVFAARMSFEGKIGRAPWKGELWLTDLWKRGRIRRTWQLVERIVSRAESDPELGAQVTSMQLWK